MPVERARTRAPRLPTPRRIEAVVAPIKEKRFLGFSFLFYLSTVLALFPSVAFGGASFVKRDIIRFYYPVWKFAVDSMKSGIFPLWNPYNSFGTPFFADIQTMVLYPLSVLLYLPDYQWAFNFFILVHLALAGALTCLWMRECGASRLGSFLSGAAFSLGGYVLSAISLTISLVTLTYFPLILLTLKRALRTEGFFWKGMLALVLLVQYFGGDPAVFFATLVVCVVFVLYKTAVESMSRRRLYLKYILDFSKAGLLFLGLSAFHSLLFYEFLKSSNRTQMGYDQVTMWSMQYNDLLSLIFPYFSDISIVFMQYWVRQSWLENAYAGVTVFLLAFLSLRAAGRNRLAGYHVLLALFGIALALGRFCAVYDLLYYSFPFFKFIRYPVRFLFLFSFAVSCLAGFGLDEVLSRLDRKESPSARPAASLAVPFLIGGLTVLVIGSMVYAVEIEAFIYSRLGPLLFKWIGRSLEPELLRDLIQPMLINMKRTAVLIGFCLAGIFIGHRFKIRKVLLGLFFILIVLADLGGVNAIEIALSGDVLNKPSHNLERLIQDKGIYRILASPQSVKLQYQPPGLETFDLTLTALRETLTPNLLLPYRISDVSGYDSIFLRDGIDVNDQRRGIKDPSSQRFFDMLNIKYLVSPKEKVGDGYTLLERSQPVNLFRNERLLPRAYLVRSAEAVKDRADILKKITSPDYEPQELIYLDVPPKEEAPLTAAPPAAEDSVRIVEYSPNRVRLEVDSARPQWLFLSDLYYPGWKAKLGQKPVPIFRANYAFRAVQVPAGKFSLEWNYDPILFRIGCVISLLSALVLVVGLWRARHRMAL